MIKSLLIITDRSA